MIATPRIPFSISKFGRPSHIITRTAVERRAAVASRVVARFIEPVPYCASDESDGDEEIQYARHRENRFARENGREQPRAAVPSHGVLDPVVVGISIVVTLLYNNTGGNVLVTMVFHAGVNGAQGLYPVTGMFTPTGEIARFAAWTILVVGLLAWFDWADLVSGRVPDATSVGKPSSGRNEDQHSLNDATGGRISSGSPLDIGNTWYLTVSERTPAEVGDDEENDE